MLRRRLQSLSPCNETTEFRTSYVKGYIVNTLAISKFYVGLPYYDNL